MLMALLHAMIMYNVFSGNEATLMGNFDWTKTMQEFPQSPRGANQPPSSRFPAQRPVMLSISDVVDARNYASVCPPYHIISLSQYILIMLH